ncbi:phospholipid:lipid A palmitoyltransferase, partial [Yersinia pestis subsp. microtus]
TARYEYHYIPLPLPLPLISIEYNRLSLQTTYIPGTYNNGNVLFTWIR